jgi:hypothetical protein
LYSERKGARDGYPSVPYQQGNTAVQLTTAGPIFGLTIPFTFRRGKGEVIEKFLLRGLENSGEKHKKKRVAKTSPMDLEILAAVRKGLKRLKIKKVSRLSVWAACLVAFWGAFRLAEIFAKSTSNFDKFSDTLQEMKHSKKRNSIITSYVSN